MPQKSVTWTIGKQKNIALIAHDSQKPVIGVKSTRIF